jgi:hypothetical protein
MIDLDRCAALDEMLARKRACCWLLSCTCKKPS